MPAPNLQLSTSYQTLVTGAAGGTAVVLSAFANTTGGAVTIDLSVNGVAASNRLLTSLSIPANDTYFFNEKLLLGVGETLQAKASAAASITNISSYLDL